MALNVHTNEQYIKYSKNKYTEKSNMGKNFKSNKKHTWMNLATLAHFPLLCAFPQDYLPKKPIPKNSSLTYIYQPSQRTPQICWRRIPSFFFLLCLSTKIIKKSPSKKKPSLIQKKKSTFLSYFLPFCNRFPHGNNIRAILLKTKSPFFQNSIDSPSK